MRMALRFIIVYIIVASGYQAFFTYILNGYIENFVRIFPITSDQHLLLHDIAVQTIIGMGVMLALGAIGIFAMSVYYSHKIAGPIYVIRNNLDKLAGGDFNIRTKFRDGDEFNEIAEAVNRLAEKIKSEQSK